LKESEKELKALTIKLKHRIDISEEKFRSLLDGLARVEIGIDIVNNNYQFLLKI